MPSSTNSNQYEKLSYFHGIPSKALLGSTIGQIVDVTSEKHPDREAYVFCESGKRASFAELKSKVK